MNNTPESTFYVTGGTLRHDAPSYVERQADKDIYDGLMRGEFCYVLTARQMGKSSLMVRTASRMREEGVAVVVLDLTAIGQNLSAEQWYDGLVHLLGMQLDLEEELENFWHEQSNMGPLHRWMAALQRVVLPALMNRTAAKQAQQGESESEPVAAESNRKSQIANPKSSVNLVIFVDEIDVVRSLPFSTDEFFAGIRECYNRRTQDVELNRLTFCLLGVASPSDLIRDTRTTPFNIGRRIELNDFAVSEAAPLSKGLGREESSANLLLQRILYWTNGHPYLTQRLCQMVAQDSDSTRLAAVDQHCANLFLSNRARERDDNLLFVRERIVRNEADLAGLLTLYDQVRSRKGVPDDETNALISILRLSGLTRVVAGKLRVRNRIYEQVFNHDWVIAHMPDAELRRQRAAFRRGIVRATGVALVVLAAMIGLVIYAVNKARQATREKENAQIASARALLAQARAGRVSGRAGQRYESLAAIAQAATTRTSLELRNEAIACLALPDLRVTKQWNGMPAGATALAMDAELARYARSDTNGNITVRRVNDDGQLLTLPGAGLPGRWLQFSPNGQYLAAGYRHQTNAEFRLWDLARRETIVKQPVGEHDTALDFSPDSRLVALVSKDETIQILELPGGTEQNSFSTNSTPSALRFHPGGKKLAAASRESTLVLILDVETGEPMKPFSHRGTINAIAWHPEGTLLAAACSDLQIYVWDAEKGDQRAVLAGHEDAPTQLAFTHGGDLLASLGADEVVRLWRPETGRQVVSFTGAGNATQLQFSLDDQRLGYSLNGTEVGLWDVAPGRECRTLFGHLSVVKGPRQLDISREGRLMASVADDGIQLWDVVLGRKFDFMAVGPTVKAIFDPTDGALIASVIYGLHQWPMQTKTGTNDSWQLGPADNLFGFRAGTGLFSMDTNGLFIAVVRGEKIHGFLAPRPGAPQRPVIFNARPGIKSIAVSPDGKWVAATSEQSDQVMVWETTTQKPQPEITAKPGANLVFSPDSQWLVTGTGGEYRFWKVNTWAPGLRLARAPGIEQPGVMAFSSDGSALALAQSSTVVQLVDPRTGSELATLTAPDQKRLSWLCFTPDGRRLAAATENHLIQVWDLPLLRQQLAALKLDWPIPDYPTQLLATTSAPLKLQVIMGSLEPGNMPTDQQSVQANLDQLTRAIEANPKDANAYFKRAQFHWQQGDLPLAQTDLDRAIELDPQKTEFLHMRAGVHFYLNNFEQAIADCSKAIELSPDNLELRTDLVELFVETQQWDKAAAAQEKVLSLSPEIVTYWWQQGLLNLVSSDTNAYRKTCETMIGRFGVAGSTNLSIVARASSLMPNNFADWPRFRQWVEQDLAGGTMQRARSQRTLGLVLYRAGLFDEVVKILSGLFVTPSPAVYDPWTGGYAKLLIAMAHQRLGHAKDARQSLEQGALAVFPLTAYKAGDGFGSLYNWPNRLELQLILREAEKLIQPDDDYFTLFSGGTASVALRAAFANLAIASFRLERDPNDAEGNNNLAWALVTGPDKARDPAAALPPALKAVELKPNTFNYLDSLGVVYYRLKQWDKAVATLELALKAPDRKPIASTLFFLALSHHGAGQTAKAEDFYNQAVTQFKSQPLFSAEQEAFFAEADATLNKTGKRDFEQSVRRERYGAQEATAKPGRIDLTDYYNKALTHTWHTATPNNDLASLPKGLQTLGGIEFDVRGIIQLRGLKLNLLRIPVRVNEIKVNRQCAQLHFLHGTGLRVKDGTKIGSYILHYADGQQRELPMVYGEHVRDWWQAYKDEPVAAPGAAIAWAGTNVASAASNTSLRLFKATWPNPRPDAAVKSIDFVSRMTDCAPFLIAITVE